MMELMNIHIAADDPLPCLDPGIGVVFVSSSCCSDIPRAVLTLKMHLPDGLSL